MNKGTIKIWISTSLTRKYLIKHIEKFHKIYPNIIINISTDPTKDLIKQLKNGKIFEIDIDSKTENIEYGLITLKNNIMSSYCNKLVEYLKLN